MMSDSNKNVVKAALTNMVSEDEQECFDFKTLPYVCQKRYAEILDPKTLKIFSNINTTTKNLSKRCHIVNEVEVDEKLSKCKYTLSCFCSETEFCRGVHESDLSSLKNKIDVHGLVYIKTGKNESVKIDARFLQSLPFTFDSNVVLGLIIHCIKLDDLKMFMPPGLKFFGCSTGIESQCSMKEFIDFIKSLTHLDAFQFDLIHPFSSLSFNADDLASEGADLVSQKVITKFEYDNDFTTFIKYPESL